MRHIHSQWAHQPRDCLALRHRRTGTRSTTTWYSNIFPADDANVGRTPRAGFLWYGCGVEYTLKCVCTSCLVPRVLHGTERQTLGVMLNLCVMIMRRYDLGEGGLVSTRMRVSNLHGTKRNEPVSRSPKPNENRKSTTTDRGTHNLRKEKSGLVVNFLFEQNLPTHTRSRRLQISL